MPAGERLRAVVGWAWARARRSIPLRTVLFLLPPLALPPLAFDLSWSATLVVALLLLWLAAAAAVFSTMMIEGSDRLAPDSIERRLERGASQDDETMGEALTAISRQLDALDEQIASLRPAAEAPTAGVPAAERPVDDAAATLSHRPQEHWPTASEDDHYELYGQPAVADTNFAEPGSTNRSADPPAQHWSESRWRP